MGISRINTCFEKTKKKILRGSEKIFFSKIFDPPSEKKFSRKGKYQSLVLSNFKKIHPVVAELRLIDVKKIQYFGRRSWSRSDQAKASKINYVMSEVLMIVYKKHKDFT